MRQIALITFILINVHYCFAQNKAVPTAPPSDSLSFAVSADKQIYALSETVTVTLVWKNLSKQDFEIMATTMMSAVNLYEEEMKKELTYQGIIACGTSGKLKIAAGENFVLENVLNFFRFPSFDLSEPGSYTVKASYSSTDFEKRPNFWSGKLDASTSFQIVRLDETALDREREKALTGDKRALQILAAHRDEAIIPALEEQIKNSDKETRETIYRALLILNTDTSIRILAEAATGKIAPPEKLSILRLLHEMKPSPNAVVIPYMEKLLADEYVGGYSTTNKEGEPPRRYKLYTVRKWAYSLLKKLGVEANVVEEEEIKETQK
jgi:hypothetical protein